LLFCLFFVRSPPPLQTFLTLVSSALALGLAYPRWR
jgi:hypothetical protein